MLRKLLLALPLLIVAPMVLAEEKPVQTEPGKRPGAANLDPAELFKKLDTNNDGKLSPDEFKGLVELPEVKARLTPSRLPFGGKLDLESLKERLGPERFEKLKERLGGQFDPEKLKELIEKRKNKNP